MCTKLLFIIKILDFPALFHSNFETIISYDSRLASRRVTPVVLFFGLGVTPFRSVPAPK